jgi:hypothetical protein
MKRGTIQRRTFGTRWFAAAAALVLLAGSALPAAGASRYPPDQISGTIHVHGCTLGPRDLTLRAQSLTSAVVADPEAFLPERPNARKGRTAVLRATDDPHVLSFMIHGLRPGQVYRLAIRDAATARGETFGDCGDLFWRGPFEALAPAGGPPILIEGFAARTQVEVLRPSTDAWQGSDHLDLARSESALRSFRWRTSLPGVRSGELQISTEPFPVVGPDGNPCAEPDGGVVYREVVDTVRTGWSQVDPIDLATALAPPRVDPRDGRVEAVATAGDVTPMTRVAFASLLSGAPLWVRVVPIRDTGPACNPEEDGVHGWSNLAKIVAEALADLPEPPDAPSLTLGPQHHYRAPYFDPNGEPKGDHYAYMVTQPHLLPTKTQAANIFNFADPVGAMLVRDHPSLASTWLYPGHYIVIDPGEPSWWDDFTDSIGHLVTGAIDAIGFLVDKVSKAYADIKAAAIEVALDVTLAIPIVKDACNAVGTETCRAAIEAGVNAGLAAMGMPPSLPNWHELQEAGADYLAAEIASQTGVPSEVTEQAIELGQEAMEDLSANRGGNDAAYVWLMPYFGFNPAVAYISLHKEGGDLPQLLSLEIGGTDLFGGESVTLPTHWSGDLTVPIVLEPNVEDIAAPVCTFPSLIGPVDVPCSDSQKARHYRNHYKVKLLANTCSKLSAMSFLYVETPPPGPTITKGPAPGPLHVATFAILDHPAQDYTWSGKFLGVCT